MLDDIGNTVAYQQGYKAYVENPWIDHFNPFEKDTSDYDYYECGWNDADFEAKVEAGYFD